MKSNQRGIAHLLLIALLFIIVTIIVFTAYLVVSSRVSRSNFQNEGLKLPVPLGCKYNYSRYTSGSFDVAESFQVEYKCNVTGSEAHDSIVASMASRGYKVRQDESNPNDKSTINAFDGTQILVYQFSFLSKHYLASYDFHPNQPNISSTAYTLEQLKSIKVTGISLRLDNASSAY